MLPAFPSHDSLGFGPLRGLVGLGPDYGTEHEKDKNDLNYPPIGPPHRQRLCWRVEQTTTRIGGECRWGATSKV